MSARSLAAPQSAMYETRAAVVSVIIAAFAMKRLVLMLRRAAMGALRLR